MALIFNILFLVIVAENFAGTFATDYCKLKSCEEKGIHTMCTYTSPKPAKACKEWSDQGFSDAERKAIVDKHNQLRQKVASGKERRGSNGPQPAAVRMPDLTWDKELETIAQRWANQCNYDHDECSDVERFQVGQNIAEESSSIKDDTSVDSMIQSWYDEVADFDRRVLSSFADPDGSIGHYTQIVWADTTKIGCGRIKYKQPDGMFGHYLVCNYGPSGNFRGRKVYEIKK